MSTMKARQIQAGLSEYTFKGILKQLYDNGQTSSPRGLEVLEVNNFCYEVQPYVRFMSFKSRKLNIDYIKREFLWYLQGDPADLSILEHAKMWRGLVNLDGTINSNYGQYIFGDGRGFMRVVNELERDKDSRRASIMILSNKHLDSETKDYPCTYAINFRIRGNYLYMTVHMRSQDAIFGMGNDLPCFSFIHEMMYHMLKATYPKLSYGSYFHIADSFHVYERHFKMLETIVDSDDPFKLTPCPEISGIEEVEFLLTGKFEQIPIDFVFTKWLHTYGQP